MDPVLFLSDPDHGSESNRVRFLDLKNQPDPPDPDPQPWCKN